MRIPNTSPTQIRLYARCPRAYWYTYPNGEREPAGPAAELGTKLHNEFERRLSDRGHWSRDDDHRVSAALQQVRDHERGGILESWVQVGHVRGRVDLLVVDSEDSIATVLDLKTTGSDRYALTEHDLPTDIQMVCYGLAVAEAHDVDLVRLVHLYTLTKGAPRAWRVETVVARSQLQHTFDTTIAPLVDGARALWHETEPPPPLEDAPNTPACNMYGGCPFRTRCGERFPIPEEDPMVDLVSSLFAQLRDPYRAEFAAMCEHTDFAAWRTEDLAGAHDVLGDMVAAQDADDENWRTGGEATPAQVCAQPVLPPDASENKAIDPLDVPLTDVPGIGPKTAERAGFATVRAFVDSLRTHAVAGDSDVPDVTQKQLEAIQEFARARDRKPVQAAPVLSPDTLLLLRTIIVETQEAIGHFDAQLDALRDTLDALDSGDGT